MKGKSSLNEVCNIFNCSPKSLYRWVKKYKMIKTLQKQHMKYKEPIKGKGIRKLFRENGYKVYLVDEYRTSCMCSKCCEGKCEKFITREDPKPYKKGNIIVHGALICKKCNAVWNRDVNGATNIFRIVKNIIDKKERPKYLCR